MMRDNVLRETDPVTYAALSPMALITLHAVRSTQLRFMAILPSPFDLPAGRLLALDLGQARTGAAVCDGEGILATPLAVLRRHATRAEDYAEIAALMAREKAVGVLVGLPLASLGEEGSQARWARRYAGRLAGALSVPVAFWDESYSSADADRLVSEGGGRTPRDAAAAAVILQDYLEARRGQSAAQSG
jgi:putative Holliday junction resolvase